MLTVFDTEFAVWVGVGHWQNDGTMGVLSCSCKMFPANDQNMLFPMAVQVGVYCGLPGFFWGGGGALLIEIPWNDACSVQDGAKDAVEKTIPAGSLGYSSGHLQVQPGDGQTSLRGILVSHASSTVTEWSRVFFLSLLCFRGTLTIHLCSFLFFFCSLGGSDEAFSNQSFGSMCYGALSVRICFSVGGGHCKNTGDCIRVISPTSADLLGIM